MQKQRLQLPSLWGNPGLYQLSNLPSINWKILCLKIFSLFFILTLKTTECRGQCGFVGWVIILQPKGCSFPSWGHAWVVGSILSTGMYNLWSGCIWKAYQLVLLSHLPSFLSKSNEKKYSLVRMKKGKKNSKSYVFCA